MSNSYNFLPPIDQWTAGSSYYPPGIGNITRLDPYLPNYQITTGDLTPLIVDGGGIPQNITGTTGPVSGSTGGYFGNPPAATPFMIMAYAEVLNAANQVGVSENSGIVQFYLSDLNVNVNDSYNLIPFTQLVDLGRVTEVYYTIDTTITINNTPKIKFYDAKLVRANPSSSINNYELFSAASGDYKGNDNSYASWPVNTNFSGSDADIMSNDFYFNELRINTAVNPYENRLKSGKLYHPYSVNMSYKDNPSETSGYTEYSNGTYFNGYGPGYPININYIFSDIKSPSTKLVIQNGNDIDVNVQGKSWPATVNLSVYNFNNDASDVYLNLNNTVNNYYNRIGAINNVENNGFLYCSCNDNNYCANGDSSTEGDLTSYWANNCNTIQAGILQYMTFQFIPFQQIKMPSTNIVTDFTNTDYSFTNLPVNIDFTPSKITNLGPTGSYPIQVQTLIDGTTGSTGNASSSIISSWMQTPNNSQYVCSNAISNTSYCGFLDYYDSLYGIAYEYGNCGDTGPISNPYQKGGCTGGQICVPNYAFMSNYNPFIQPVFTCVDINTGITTENMQNYINSVPVRNQNTNTNVIYPQYTPVSIPTSTPNFADSKKNKSTQRNDFYLYIALVVAVLVIIFVIYFVVSYVNRKKTYKFYKT